MLEIENLISGYGRIEALHGVSMNIKPGEIVSLVGANGAGKTTLLRAISGVQSVSAGTIRFEGQAIDRLPAHARVPLGIAQVPEGRQLFAPLTATDNLMLGAWWRRADDLSAELARVHELFPMLRPLSRSTAGMLSGGQQQMLAIGRALMSKPRLLLLDEPSLGLAPILVDQILDAIVRLKSEGVTVLLIEQNARAALAIADRAYVLETGRITASGTASEIASDERVQRAYLGI
ncbi:MAG: ABC transporter ATP-binding protein [Pseudorhodoplanes sp.]|nr:ABC transporter ATP-binding protein [Pseudorhodoplanes sp.]MCL4710977.1 ABC transporter ATP-binding protein [Pseudorhodoplanes sp.]MCQ3942144.1 ABC transporter ATP-binding protein [Alphaproteobacteria bacterium]GIK80351.1 MAG: ABC transporter ATP-binding protein [Alphaproteobacteria bacterium]